MAPLSFSEKMLDKVNTVGLGVNAGLPVESDVDIDLREIYFLIMHFLSEGPCKRTYGQLWNELLEHQLLPRRYHAWYSRRGAKNGDAVDNGISLPLCYQNLVERVEITWEGKFLSLVDRVLRILVMNYFNMVHNLFEYPTQQLFFEYPHIEKDHLVKLLKQLILSSLPLSHAVVGGPPNAADGPTLLGSGSFSLLGSVRDKERKATCRLPDYLRWPHVHADQVHGLSLREIGGGFTKHHRAPSVRAACYAIAKPSTLVQKMQIIKKLRGHQNAVYCAIFDRLGRHIITGSDDRLVKIWSMETALCLASCRGHEGDITDLAVSSNNALVASSSNDFIIRVWRLPDGLPISVLRGHTGVVTAIAFSPRTNASYQLLSSSDDGTCRIWDARYSQLSPKIYVPKPLDAIPGKGNNPTPNIGQRSHLILCCAFNSNGTVFVTGSSDTHARVWNACKSITEDSEQACQELDLLSGHDNDVNYVQFSGCSVASRSSIADSLKEDNLPKFKNSWFTHDNIVTCSRDGSAIIWIPRSRRSHGKNGRWTRAYHLKVPPPPMPPQPIRGGPRQRHQPTPRGVNMIVWSLDNRFVLAAIMDCRICVWNASDGSLVHSLRGHSESTFVLDVHPFNPRIAMSAGYDGKTIIWDIWEGTPVQIYDTGRFKLVDGKFAPDGTSIILSDDVGQLYIIATGQGESQKDAKYDQFFLGDFRPFIQDAHGNFLDQETQLPPYHRNMQDLLCDSSMIPYPEPYQSMYQQRRLGTLGIGWRPPSVKFAVGPTYNSNTGEYQMLPILDLDRWVEPLPEFIEAIDWEHENEVQSDDADSEYNVTDESEGEHVSLSGGFSGSHEFSAEDSGIDHNSKEVLRRSGRKKLKSKMDLTTSSGRRIKRRNLVEHEVISLSRAPRARRLRNGHPASTKKASKSKSLRSQRRAARNAIDFFSQINEVSSDDEEEYESGSSSSESESVLQYSSTHSVEAEKSMQNIHSKHLREIESFRDEHRGDVQSQGIDNPANAVSTKRLILKLPRRNLESVVSSRNTQPELHQNDVVHSVAKYDSENFNIIHSSTFEPGQSSGIVVDLMLTENDISREVRETSDHNNLPTDYKGSTIKWGEVKLRSSKRLRLSDNSVMDAWPVSKECLGSPNIVQADINGYVKSENEHGTFSVPGNQAHAGPVLKEGYSSKALPKDCALQGLDGAGSEVLYFQSRFSPLEPNQSCPNVGQQDKVASIVTTSRHMNKAHEDSYGTEFRGMAEPQEGSKTTIGNTTFSLSSQNNGSPKTEEDRSVQPTYRRLKIRSNGLTKENIVSSSKLKSGVLEDLSSGCDLVSKTLVVEDNDDTGGQCSMQNELNNCSGSLETCTYENAKLHSTHTSNNSHASFGKMYNAVYKRSNSSKYRKHSECDNDAMEGSTSNCDKHSRTMEIDYSDPVTEGICRTRSRGTRAKIDALDINLNGDGQITFDEWRPTSRITVGLRSSRNRWGSCNASPRQPDKGKCNQPFRKPSWLMLLEHEEGYRYIPQQGDEVVYLRQGHEEYIKAYGPQDPVPWRPVKGTLMALEYCKVQELVYATHAGSGDSCCKLTLEFVDPSSRGFGKSFKLTLPELVSFPDFLVERTRFEASIERNWTHRDKCQVWWRNEGGNSGSWWEGRVLAVKAKSPEFPESPWERYVIQYKNDSSLHHFHSPWEFHDAGCQWEHPHIAEESRNKLLFSLAKIVQTSTKNQDYYGIQKLNQVAQKSDFVNRFPLPLSLEVIKRRLENNYYRNIEAVQHDASVMLSNAETYFCRSADIGKIRRLSDWITQAFSTL